MMKTVLPGCASPPPGAIRQVATRSATLFAPTLNIKVNSKLLNK
jgi:hypothetical protein